MNLFEELSWPQFQSLNHVRRLPLNEQVRQYNQYLNELSEARQSWIIYQNKGPRRTQETQELFLLQEDGFYLLQEDGFKIELPAYA